MNQKALILETLTRLKHVLKCLLLYNHISMSKDCNVALTVIIKLNFVLNILVLKIEYVLQALAFIYTYMSHVYNIDLL